MDQNVFRQLGRHYRAGEIIYRQGELAEHFFVVQHGQVEITRETSRGHSLLVEPGEGEVFGIVALFTPSHTRFSTARAKSEARILSIDARLFIARLHQDPSTAFRIIRHLSQRIYDLDRAMPPGDNLASHGSGALLEERYEHKLLNVNDFSVGHHVLVVEDDVEFALLIREWLREAVVESEQPQLFPSCKLTLANTFRQADQLLGREKYDLILLDLNLSDSHGYAETFLRINDRAFDTPIIVFTSMDDDRQAIRAVDEGAQDYLIKGQVNKRNFIHAICHALSRHRLYHHPVTGEPEEPEWDRRYALSLFDWSLSLQHHRRAAC